MNHQQRLAMPSSHLEMPDLDLSNLDERQKIFVLKYITNGFNGAAAAEASYYPPGSAKVRASEMLKDPDIKAAIALVMNARCGVLGVDANWVLDKAVTLFDRCMQTEKVIDQYGATGEFKFDAANAIRALNIIGKHVDVRAFEVKDATSTINDDLIARLNQGRQRVAIQQPLVTKPIEVSPVEIEDLPFEEIEDEPEISFMHPPTMNSENVTDISEPDALVTDEEKLARLMKHWRSNPHNR